MKYYRGRRSVRVRWPLLALEGDLVSSMVAIALRRDGVLELLESLAEGATRVR
jgi:hypothetical protein